MSTELPSFEELQISIEVLARKVRRWRLITGVLGVSVAVLMIGLFFPQVLAGLALLAFIAGFFIAMLFFIPSMAGLLEWWSRSRRLDEVAVPIETRMPANSVVRS